MEGGTRPKHCPSQKLHVDGPGSAEAEAEGQTRGRDGSKIAKSVAESGGRSESDSLIVNSLAKSVLFPFTESVPLALPQTVSKTGAQPKWTVARHQPATI